MQQSNIIPLSVTPNAIEYIIKESEIFQIELLKFLEQCLFYKGNNFIDSRSPDLLIFYNILSSISIKLNSPKDKNPEYVQTKINTNLNFVKQLQYATI